jgi:hypothetical protein
MEMNPDPEGVAHRSMDDIEGSMKADQGFAPSAGHPAAIFSNFLIQYALFSNQ